jgi:uncharacterized membrane protein
VERASRIAERSTVSKLILIAAWLACVLQGVVHYGQLPQRLPAHFNAQGIATSFAAKNVVIGVYLGGTFLLMLLFLRFGSRLSTVSDRRFKLPNKDYWLAPERSAETLATIARRFHWFGVATLALLFDIFHQIVRVALGYGRTLDHAPWSIGIYGGFALVWVIAFTARFRRTGG